MLIHILKGAGLRDGEVQHLQWNGMYASRQEARRVRSKAAEYGWKIKDKEERDIPLTDELLKVLKEWREANPKACASASYGLWTCQTQSY